jgi:uncharacterized protein (TIGR03067 family)
MTKYVLTILVVGLLLAAEDKKGDAQKDQEALQGTWKAVSSERDGKDQTDLAKGLTLTFDKENFTWKKGDEVLLKGTFKLDPSKKPRAIDIAVMQIGKDEVKDKEMQGIYELDKGTLKWCATDGGRDTARPKEFATKTGTRVFLVTFKKQRP